MNCWKKLKNDLLGTDADAHIAEPEQEDAELAQVADAGTEEVPKAVLEEPVRPLEAESSDRDLPDAAAGAMGSEALSAVNEEDILAAWGIARSELEKRKQSASSASQAEPDQPRETPTSKHTRVYYITRVEKKRCACASKTIGNAGADSRLRPDGLYAD